MPFSNLLGGAALEDAVRRVSESEYGDRLWLRNGSVLGARQYQRRLFLKLQYDYIVFGTAQEKHANKRMLQELSEGFCQRIFHGADECGFTFYVQDSLYNQNLQLHLRAELENMEVPISIYVTPLWNEKRSSVRDFALSVIEEGVAVPYERHSTESALAQSFLEIVTKLEFLQNVGLYHEIYHMLSSRSIDGRKVRDCMEELCKEQGLPLEQERFEILAGYREYAYMKRKWKAFLRSIHSKEPSWTVTMDRFLQFFGPIWKAIVEDTVFFGDWMPELGRFL